MAYDVDLAQKVRSGLGAATAVGELEMFGGWCATIAGNVAVGVLGGDLIVRVGAEDYDHALSLRGARPFDYGGRPMRGWVFVDEEGTRDVRSLRRWIDRGVTFARTLPAKPVRRR